MESAKLILEYVRVLIWPVFIIIALLIFRGEFVALLGRIQRAEFAGGSLSFEVVESRQTPGEWRVESFNYDDGGEATVVTFSGYLAEQLAKEYVEWKTGRG
jgi:hypothetical protein